MTSTITKRTLLAAGAATAPALLLGSAGRGQAVQSPPLANTPIPKAFFGIHMMAYCDPPLFPNYVQQPYLDLGQGSFRIWSADGGWKWIQRGGPGSFDWIRLDNMVNGVRAAGVPEVIFTIGASTPVWASGGMDTFSGHRQFNGFPPLKESDWTDFITALVTRFRGRITAYEIWNEWDLKGSWRGTPEQMLRFAELAYQTIKSNDPRATVISPTICSTESKLDAYQAFLAMGGLQYCDVVGMHGYCGSNPPETLIPWIEKIRGLATSVGKVNKPLWNTEMGVNYWLDERGARRNLKGKDPIPDDRGAAYVARLMMASWLGGAVRAEFYDMDSPEVEAVSLSQWPKDPMKLTAGGRAYQALAKLLTGGTLGNYREEGGVHTADFTTVAGGRRRPGTVYWRHEFQSAPFPIRGAQRAQDVLGAPIDIASGSIDLTASPVYVFQA